MIGGAPFIKAAFGKKSTKTDTKNVILALSITFIISALFFEIGFNVSVYLAKFSESFYNPLARLLVGFIIPVLIIAILWHIITRYIKLAK